MKSVIISSICVSAVLLVLAIQSRINGMACYRQELEEALSISISQTLKEVMEQESYGIGDRNEFIAAFLQALVVRTNSDVDMTVYVIGADLEKGMLDIEVRERVCDERILGLAGSGAREKKNAALTEETDFSKGSSDRFQTGMEIAVRRTVIFEHAG